jgi:hypothetical protein
MAGYGWVEALEAYCFTVIVGPRLHIDDTVRRLGGDPDRTEGPRTFEECFWPAEGPQWAQVGPVPGGLLVAEHNGWRAEEVVEPLSQGARLVCFFRNVHAITHFVYAVDGRILAEFDPLLDHQPASGADPGVIDAARRDLPFGLFSAEQSALALLERLTAVRIDPDWLARPQRVVALPPLTSALPQRAA